jgi:glucose-6-phosphate 1-dehydrogenase
MPSPPNYLRFRLGPGQVAIAVGARVKRHGIENIGDEVELFVCNTHDDAMEAYERLIGDAMKGDATLFAREDGVEAAWRIVDPILDKKTPVREYEPGTWGPGETDAMVSGVGGWRNPEGA